MKDIGEILNFSFAEDIESEWDMYMEDGYTIQEATTQIIDQYVGMLDEEENVELYVALGVIQMTLEEIDSRVKKEVSEIVGTKTLERCFKNDISVKSFLQRLKKQCR